MEKQQPEPIMFRTYYPEEMSDRIQKIVEQLNASFPMYSASELEQPDILLTEGDAITLGIGTKTTLAAMHELCNIDGISIRSWVLKFPEIPNA